MSQPSSNKKPIVPNLSGSILRSVQQQAKQAAYSSSHPNIDNTDVIQKLLNLNAQTDQDAFLEKIKEEIEIIESIYDGEGLIIN